MATATSMGFSLFSTWDGRGARQARKELTGLRKVTKDLGTFTAVAFGAAAIAVGAYGAAVVKAGIQSNALVQRTNKALQTTLGSTSAARDQMEALREFGKTSPIQLPVWIKAQQKMLAFGIEAEKIVPLLTGVQDAVIAAGGTEEEISGVVRALSQMQSKGKLSAEELNQIGERGIDAAGIVANAFGTTAGEIRARITEGRISVDEFFNGFIQGADEAFGGAAAGARETFAGMVDRLKGAHRRIGEILATPLVDPAGGGALVELGNALADAMNNFEDALRPLLETLAVKFDPAIQNAAENIRDFGESITTEKISNFFDTLKQGLPILSAFGTAMGVHIGAQALELVPGLQRIAGAISPVAVGLAALAATSPELRSALVEVGGAITPLVPVFAEFATTVATVLTASLKVVVPLIEAGATAIGFLTDNFGIVAPVVTAAAIALGIYSVNTTRVTIASTAAGIATLRLRDTMIALRASMLAHPVLAIATILLAVGSAFILANDEANEWKKTLTTAFAEAEAGAKSFQEALKIPEAEQFRESIADLEQALKDVESGGENLARTAAESRQNLDKQTIAQDNLNDALDEAKPLIDELDSAMASQVQSGENAAFVLQDVQAALGLTDDQIEVLLPRLDDYQAATEAAVEENAELAVEIGNALAALQGFGEEMKAQTDPYFALIKAEGDLREAQEKRDEVMGNAGASAEDVTEANLALIEALIAFQIAGEEAGTVIGEDLPEDLKTLAESFGIDIEAIDQLNGAWDDTSGNFQEGADNMLQSSADLAAGLLENTGQMTSGMAESSANIAESLEEMVAGGDSVSESLQFMANNSSQSREEIIENMLLMRDAGFDFSERMDAFLDSVATDYSEMDSAAKSAGENMADYLSGLSEDQAAVEDTTDNMGRRHNAVMEGMDTDTDSHIDNMIDRWNDLTSNGIGLADGGINDLAGNWAAKLGIMEGDTSSAWRSIKNSISDPVDFVIGNLYNDGIVKFWNKISGAMFGGKGKLSTVGGFAEGGRVRGPGTGTSDSINARLSNGEFVMRKKAVDNIGVHRLEALNSLQLPGFSLGGFFSNAAGNIASGMNLFDQLGDHGTDNWLGGMMDIWDAVSGMGSRLTDMLGGIPSDSNSKKFVEMLSAGAKRIIEPFTDFTGNLSGMFGGDFDPSGMPTTSGGSGSIMGYKNMFAWISSAVPGANLTSGFRPGDPGYHGRGRATDLTFADGSERRGGGLAMRAFNTIVGAFGKNTKELIWDYSPFGYGTGIWNGGVHTFNSPSAAPPSHNDHIHWAMAQGGPVSFDQGGFLQPGFTLAHNGTGIPEPVGHGLRGNTYIINVNGPVANRRGAEDMIVQGLKDAQDHGRIPR